MSLIVKSGTAACITQWRELFAQHLPELKVQWWDDPDIIPDEIRYALVWEPEAGRLASYKNLEIIFSSGAGIDHLLIDPSLPPAVPLVRMVTEETGQRMAEYVTWAVLSLHLRIDQALQQQERKVWHTYDIPRTAAQRRVGVMGLGGLGQSCAKMLANVGFQVSGWSRGRKKVGQVASYAGKDELAPFLSCCDILICLLPSTPETAGILNEETLNLLPEGAGIINAGRGDHIIDQALLDALDKGHVGAAILDVFSEEPLSSYSPYWNHPKVIVTPHIAANPSRAARVSYVADSITRHRRGESLPNQYDLKRGY
ncbi:glyoxylate/hydroxypyruvate reductase A [Paenalcaligenes niemegkensis]|uniref:2-hydroxyacid dehydrogenase n=1 Tax=Paenalcaligenes niemegkensis TaxID=2895469 RepID=UPI001EE8C8E0|nr:glyoxylate/hydroxypyruvate reductase A [Paenalcaligenes niemegkensis]MCQ9615602.1 glyoxylate/hydroxypyruvate reductase A [Paenalcaligenes niemegkensis]